MTIGMMPPSHAWRRTASGVSGNPESVSDTLESPNTPVRNVSMSINTDTSAGRTPDADDAVTSSMNAASRNRSNDIGVHSGRLRSSSTLASMAASSRA